MFTELIGNAHCDSDEGGTQGNERQCVGEGGGKKVFCEVLRFPY